MTVNIQLQTDYGYIIEVRSYYSTGLPGWVAAARFGISCQSQRRGVVF